MPGEALGAIFVGGASSRMGGAPKGLLRVGGETLVARAARLLGEAGLPCALVGRRPEYADLGLDVIDDEAPGLGPLGGLAGALAEARRRGARCVVAVACDMPFFSVDLLARLLAAPAGALAAAPLREGRFEPLFARYDVALLDAVRARLEVRRLSLQGLLAGVEVFPVALSPGEGSLLDDWDRPEDIR